MLVAVVLNGLGRRLSRVKVGGFGGGVLGFKETSLLRADSGGERWLGCLRK